MKRGYIFIFALATLVFSSSAHAQSKSFNQNLYFGLTGNTDVQNLQEFLTTEGVYSGPVTGNFFSLTAQGVKAFQASNGIQPVSGYFGPLTRAAANQILAAQLQVYNSQFGVQTQTQIGPITSSTTTTPPTATGLSMIDLLQARIGSFFQQLWSLQGKNKTTTATTPAAAATSTPPVVSGGGGGGGGGSSGGGGGSATPPAPAPVPVPAPSTTTININVVMKGGSASATNFTLTAKDNTAATVAYSGSASVSTMPLSFVQGDTYSITEATTSNAVNYTIAAGTTCSGTAPSTVVNCTFTNTYVAPPASSTPAPVPAPALTIVPSTLPNGTTTVAYATTILTASTTASGPFTWSINSGSLPGGLSLKSTTGATTTITGTPGTAGKSTFSIKATNGTSSSTQNYTVTIFTAPVIIPTSTTPTSTTLLWGAYVGDIDANPSLVASFDTLTGANSNIIASFMDLSSGDFPSAEKTVVGAKGKTLLMFLEPQYSFDQINSGKYDSVLQQYATAAASYGSPIILAPFDEFNLNENPWGYSVGGNTPTKFIQAWQHIHSFFVNDPNVKFALVYNNVPEPADSVNTYAAYYPGDAYVDYVGVDGFNFNNTNASAQTFDQIFNPIMPYLQSLNKPILFTSIGSVDYPNKPQWITYGLGTYIEQYSNVAGWVYFNFDDTSAGQNWRIDTSAASLAAFEAVIPK